MDNTQTNGNMLRFSPSGMLEEWKMRKGLFPGLRNCTVERNDGTDTDGLLRREIDGWYARLLAEAPAECLPVYDISEACDVETDSRLTALITLPERCVRPTELRMRCWADSVCHFFPADSPAARMQSNEWLRGRQERPVCVLSGRQIRAYSAASAGDAKLEKLLAVCYPPDGSYVFSERAWSVFPEYFEIF